ncbi:Spy/CpxP family protein refolding chaperone [uncultured Propionivibrio sp.]|uniref:Spy/CpxP family protein refolding chaperone n=1 Tax=uncultured Propionivibrio sp. TaxID=426737 RepID=UPI0029C0F41B|nr:Spy/CpxP family protein refolding chaperone [uncultured Propionivibrio sp.]
MPRRIFARSAIVAGIVVLSACATPYGGGMGGPGGGPGGMGGGGMNGGERGVSQGAAFKSPIEQIQEQLVDTAMALKLTPKQAVLWDTYQASVGALMADQVKQELFATTPRTALQLINGKVDVVRNRLTAMEEIAERATTLYQSLDDGQKTIADQRLAATVPALYSGLVVQSGGGRAGGGQEQGGHGGRGGPGGMGGPGGGMGRF